MDPVITVGGAGSPFDVALNPKIAPSPRSATKTISTGTGVGDGLGDGLGDAVGDGLGDGLGEGNGLGEGEGDGDGLELARGLELALGDVVAVGEFDGIALAEAAADARGDAVAVDCGDGLAGCTFGGTGLPDPPLHPPINSANIKTETKFRTGIVTQPQVIIAARKSSERRIRMELRVYDDGMRATRT